MFRDGVIDLDERIELEDLLLEIVGEDEGRTTALDRPTQVAFDDPLPTLEFPDWSYVLTGRFAFGTRKICEEEIVSRGGAVEKNVTQQTRVVVVGTFASPAWVQSAFGTKILSALERRDRGRRVHIVPEQHWLRFLS